jgi:hypothetical protein
MYSNRQSVVYWRRRRVLAKELHTGIEPVIHRNKRRSQFLWTVIMYSEPAVAAVSSSKGPTKGCQELLSLRPSASAARGELTVDWPLRLRETSAPFTSRSPGIATLGPSYVLPAGSWAIVLRLLLDATGSRRSSRIAEIAREPNEVSPRPCHGHRLTACDVVPAGSWATCCDRPTKDWLRHGSFSQRL